MNEKPIKLGIVREFADRHRHYVVACEELRIAHEVMDLSGPDWISRVQASDCDGFLIRPSGNLTIWKQMYDERLAVLVEVLHRPIFPSLEEIWLYESKRRGHYWLEANGIPHPRTWVFYDQDEALQWARSVPLPVVYKSDLGSASSGVRIFRGRWQLQWFIRKLFWWGFVRTGGDRRDRLWGCALFQEYLPEVREWRVIQVAGSYFAWRKGRKGDFHSGSKITLWENPPPALLDFAHDINVRGGFSSMAIDIFETVDGRWLVNELQTLFGTSTASQMQIDGLSGRYRRTAAGHWEFEEGLFSRNGCCNLRVEAFVAQLRQQAREAQR